MKFSMQNFNQFRLLWIILYFQFPWCLLTSCFICIFHLPSILTAIKEIESYVSHQSLSWKYTRLSAFLVIGQISGKTATKEKYFRFSYKFNRGTWYMKSYMTICQNNSHVLLSSCWRKKRHVLKEVYHQINLLIIFGFFH